MALGILTNVSAIYAANNLNNTQASLSKVLQQLSSGARINSGADDAAGLAIADGLKANQAALTQSQRNAADGIGLLSTADGAFSQVTNLLDRAITLATQVANGTLSDSQVSSANQEYTSIIKQIGSIGSTTNFNGINVFGASPKQFYVGDGTATGSNFYSDTLGALTQSSVGLSAPTATSASVTVGGVAAANATTAATITYTVANSNDTLSGTLAINFGNPATSTPSITFAAGTTLAQAVSQINASTVLSGANGVTASLTNGGKTLTLTGNNVTAATTTGNVSDGGSSLKDSQSTVALTVGTNSASTTAAAGFVAFAALQNPTTDTITGTLTIKQGSNSAVSTQFAPGTTLAAAVLQINNSSAFKAAGLTATGVAGVLKITGIQDTSVSGTNSLVSTGTNLYDAPPVALPGVGTDFTSAALSSLTTAGSQAVLTGVNQAIQNVAFQRGVIGTYSNELSAASNTAASANVNLASAESNIRSTNYGEATSDLAKYEVLSQTGIAALAQANSVQQEILKLLQ